MTKTTTITPNQIQAFETRLANEKGIKAPEVHCSITTRGYLIWASSYTPTYQQICDSSTHDTPEGAIEAFSKAIDALPDPETAKRNEYLATLDKASELAKDLGYDTNFITNEMLRLSENALTSEPA